ncbi:MAG: phosphoribosylformylglycinamidine cyclo-ligase [Myxococcales bacterium]|nr:phosphoribosylformylglycinamidine cyclo-ligase [Myxococcales bacterium]
MPSARPLTYADSGVDIERGDEFVKRIAPLARATHRAEVLAGVGGFAGLFALGGRFRDPVLVSGTDGVGTKLKLAFETGRHGTIGRDLVAMCVNDVLCTGAEPLFFLDYFATNRLDPEAATAVIAGIADGCREAGCALLGGETAELPGFYGDGEYDLAGFAVGVVERAAILDGRRVEPGDRVLGVAASGLHSNGFSLARKALLEVLHLPLAGPSLGGAHLDLAAELLEPTRIYVRPVLALLAAHPVHAIAHITGGGLPGNVPRVLPPGTRAVLDRSAWREPVVYGALRDAGVGEVELARTFNLGLGLVIVVPAHAEAAALAHLNGAGFAAQRVGRIEASAAPEPDCELVGRPA